MKPLEAHAVVRVFYRDYANGVSIPSSAPESLLLERLAPLADRIWSSADNFIGIVDRSDVILQCYAEDESRGIVFELVFPEQSGALQLILPREEALQRLRELPEHFDDSLLPGAQRID